MITHPLLSLPQHVLDTVFSHLTAANLAVCSLVCQAWRNLPYEHLPTKLDVQAGPLATGILDAGLHRCRQVLLTPLCPSPAQAAASLHAKSSLHLLTHHLAGVLQEPAHHMCYQQQGPSLASLRCRAG